MADRLLTLLRERSFARRAVTLASGRQSDWFLDCKQTVLLAEGHALVAERMLAALVTFGEGVVAVAGVALGGCSLASAVSLLSFQKGMPLDAVYVRKTVKDHGSRRPIEGDEHLADGSRVVIVEDVITTAGSTLAAVDKLRDRGLSVAGVVALVDRGEGGAGALSGAGVPFVALYSRRDFMPD